MYPDLELVLSRLINATLVALPWLLGGVGLTAIIANSRVGRAILEHTKDRRKDRELTESMLTELSEVRQFLGELAERLDAPDQGRQLSPGTEPSHAKRSIRTPTPV